MKKILAKSLILCYDIVCCKADIFLFVGSISGTGGRLVGMADEVDSKSIDGNIVRVQVPQPALLGRGENRGSDLFPRFFLLYNFCIILEELLKQHLKPEVDKRIICVIHQKHNGQPHNRQIPGHPNPGNPSIRRKPKVFPLHDTLKDSAS